MIHYCTTSRITPPETAEDSWNFAAQFTPHPVSFGYWVPVDSEGAAVGNFAAMLNTQLEGATHAAKMSSFLGLVERWRLAYMGVSIHFDGPALSNQGTVVVNQAPYEPISFYTGFTDVGGFGQLVAFPRICVADGFEGHLGLDFPNYDRSASMPNMYTGEVKNGAYIPVKLTKTCQQWHSKADLNLWATTVRENGAFGESRLQLSQTPVNLQYPFPGLAEFTFANASGPVLPIEATSCLLNDVVANVCARNMSVNSSLIVTVRIGIEAMVQPGSTLSPYQHVSPQYDSVALKAYFLVARELKDAYPVDYNDLGKLWDTIAGAIDTVAPILSVINPLLGTGAKGIVMAGNAVRGLIAKKKKASATAPKEKLSAAAQERVVKALQQGMTAAQGQRGRSKQPRAGK